MGLGVNVVDTKFLPGNERAGWILPVPESHFWCEYFEGAHYSVDYIYGDQCLEHTFVGEKYDDVHFKSWKRARIELPLPEIMRDLERLEQLNCEYIGDKLIEVNLRWNEDGWDEETEELRPIWTGMVLEHPGEGWKFIQNEDETDTKRRLGFWAKLGANHSQRTTRHICEIQLAPREGIKPSSTELEVP